MYPGAYYHPYASWYPSYTLYPQQSLYPFHPMYPATATNHGSITHQSGSASFAGPAPSSSGPRAQGGRELEALYSRLTDACRVSRLRLAYRWLNLPDRLGANNPRRV